LISTFSRSRRSRSCRNIFRIAAAGPIVGPILAGLMFGWVPALIWIFGRLDLHRRVHDMAALWRRSGTKRIDRRGRSRADESVSYFLFLTFIWIALVYIIVALPT